MDTDKHRCDWSAEYHPGFAQVGVQALACSRNTLKRELQRAETVLGAPLRILSVFIRVHPWFNTVNA
jgi:hypothetical protein